MSAHIDNINNTNNQDRQDPSGGDVEHVAPDDQAIHRLSASSTLPTTSAEHIRARVEGHEDGSIVYPEEGLILSCDRVPDAHATGVINQTG